MPIRRIIELTIEAARKHGEESKVVHISPHMHGILLAEDGCPEGAHMYAIGDPYRAGVAIVVDENCPPSTVVVGGLAADWCGYA